MAITVEEIARSIGFGLDIDVQYATRLSGLNVDQATMLRQGLVAKQLFLFLSDLDPAGIPLTPEQLQYVRTNISVLSDYFPRNPSALDVFDEQVVIS